MIPSQEMAEHRVYMQDKGEEETDLEFDEEYVVGSDIQHFRRQVKTMTASNSTSITSLSSALPETGSNALVHET